MLAVLSPYHLTTREPASSAALLLAEHAVTLLPGAGDAGRSASAHHTRYAEFIESWRWTVPLWEAGVLASAFEDDDPGADVAAARHDLTHDARYERLRQIAGLPEPGIAEEDARADNEPTLDAVARDLLRAGPDPAISLPVAVGLDRFAARHDLISVRAEARSLAHKAEDRMSETLFRVALPVLLQADADRILDARDELVGVLETLREAISACFWTGADAQDVRDAGADYERAFEARRDDLVRVVDPDEPRVLATMVAITGAVLPADGVLTACAKTAASVGGRRGSAAAAVVDGPGTATLSIRVMGRGA